MIHKQMLPYQTIQRCCLLLVIVWLVCPAASAQLTENPTDAPNGKDQSKISQLLKQLKTLQQSERRQRELAEIRLHALQLRRASDFWNAGKLLTARDILRQTKPEHRGFAYGYLDARFNRGQRELRVENKYSPGGKAVAVSPDGKVIVTSGLTVDQTVRVWDAQTGKLSMVLNGHHGFIECLAISNDGQTIASGDIRNKVLLWDVKTGELKSTIDVHDEDVLAVAFSPNNDRIVTGGADRLAKVWDIQTGKKLLEFDQTNASVTSVAYSPNGQWIASAGSTVKLWNAETGALKHDLGAGTGGCVAFSPNGKLIATGQLNGKSRATVFDAETGRVKASLDSIKSQANGICFSPDGQTIAVACEDHAVHICDPNTGEQREILTGHTHAVHDVAFLQNDRLVSIGRFSTRIFELGRESRPLTFDSTTRGAHSPDGQLLATGTTDGVEIRDLASGKILFSLAEQGKITAVDFSPNGRLLAAGGAKKTIKLWDLASGEELASLDGLDDQPKRLQFSPDGSQLASLTDETLVIWQIKPQMEKNYQIDVGEKGAIGRAAFTFSPDGNRLAFYKDKTIKILNARTGGFSHGLDESERPTTLEFSPDGEHLLGGYFYPWGPGDFARVWNANSGQKLIALNGTSASYGPKPKWSTDGQFFLTRNGKPSGVNVWDARTGGRVSNMHPRTLMNDAVFFPSGKRIASAGADTVTIFDTATGEQLLTLPHSGANYLSTSSDGKYLVANEYNSVDDYTLTIWDATVPEE